MVELSFDPAADNEVIVLAEHFQKFDGSVRARFFKIGGSRITSYTLPLSVARILWNRLQFEAQCEGTQGVLGKLDYELHAKNRIPKSTKSLDFTQNIR
jgi:hypothetical protein